MKFKRGTVLEPTAGTDIRGAARQAVRQAENRERDVWLRFNGKFLRVRSQWKVRSAEDIIEDYHRMTNDG